MKKIYSLAIGTAMLLAAGTAQAYDNLTPQQAHDAVAYGGAYILDVRTDAEYIWVGHPKATPDNIINISYQKENKGQLIVNPTFISDVDGFFGGNMDMHIITICRSGGRSVAAAIALEAAGYTNVSNMLKGYEGDVNPATGYRTINGWKNTPGLKGHSSSYNDGTAYGD